MPEKKKNAKVIQ